MLRLFIVLIFTIANIYDTIADDVALANRLAKQLCSNVDNLKFGRVQPDSTSGTICPVFEKDQMLKQQWKFDNCGGGGGGGGGGGDEDDRIVDGVESVPHSRPYTAYMKSISQNGKPMSAVIYNAYTLVTTIGILGTISKEYGNETNVPILLGKHNTAVEKTEQLRFMCAISQKKEFNDLTVIHLYDPIDLNNFASTIKFASKIQVEPRNNCTVSGWGSQSQSAPYPLTLTEKEVNVQDCKVVVPNEICVLDTYCFGDNGAALVCTDKGRIYASGIMFGLSSTNTCGGEIFLHDLRSQELHDWVTQEIEKHKSSCRASEFFDSSP